MEVEKKYSEEFEKDGFVWKRTGSDAKKRRIGKKKWGCYYFNLIGGSLHYYKDFEDQDPKGTIEINRLKLYKDDNQGSSQKFCFSLKNDQLDYLLYLEEEEEWKEWIAAIENNVGKSSCPPLKKEKRRSRAQELAFKLKKNVGGAAATSPLGKRAIKSQAPEEVRQLIASLKRVVERESKSSKKASEIEENLFKIGIKAYFLVDGKKCKIDDLLEAEKPLRKCLDILIKVFNQLKYSRNPVGFVERKFLTFEKLSKDALRSKMEEAASLLQRSAEILTKLFSLYMKPKNIALIKDTMDYFDSDRLTTIFSRSALDEDLQDLIDAADHYTQFHFYSSKER